MLALDTVITIVGACLIVVVLLLLLGIVFVMANRRFWKSWRIGIFWESERSDASIERSGESPVTERTIIEREPDV